MRCEELQLELSSALRARGASTAATWSTQAGQPASEIERIMAKIEQDNRILAELEHTRSTTHGKGGDLKKFSPCDYLLNHFLCFACYQECKRADRIRL